MMDPYVYPRSGQLKNKAGLDSPEALAAHEARMVFKRLIFLYSRPVTGAFDLAHLLAIHRALFQDVYPWAGHVRSCDLSLGQVSFCSAQRLESSLTALFAELARENWLRERNAEKFAHGAAYYLAELNAIHPFRDGNGRTQREFIRALGLSVGHKVRWAPITQFEMYTASKLSMVTRNPVGLVHILRKALGLK
jgi:cell filamentation protein